MIITTPFPRGPHVPRPVRTYMRPSPSTPHSYSMFPINNHIKDVSWWRYSPALLVSYDTLAGHTWQKLHSDAIATAVHRFLLVIYQPVDKLESCAALTSQLTQP